MESDELRAAAARLRIARYGGDGDNPLSGIAMAYSKSPSGFEDIAQLSKDQLAIVEAYLAENPADSDEPITEEWLRTFSEMEVATTKRLAYIVTWCGLLSIEWCPQCGDMPPLLCLDKRVLRENPTRGQLRLLARALGIPLKS